MEKRTFSLMAAAGAVLALPALTLATEDETAELRARLAAMENELTALRVATGDRSLTGEQHDALGQLTDEALNGPEIQTASFMQSATSGYNKGFFIHSDDESFALKINGQLQFRYVFNYRDDGDGDIDSTREGFEVRRMKLKFKGHVYDDWKYGITGAFSRSDGEFHLEDAYIQKKLNDEGWSIKAGQFKGPFMREELVSSSAQLLVDRSLVNEAFNQDFTQGIQLGYEGDQFRMFAMYNEGANQDNTSALAEDTEFAFTARAEFLFGDDQDWGRFKDFTSMPGSEFAGLVGVGFHYQADERGTGDGSGTTFNDDEADVFAATADVGLEFDGANLFASFVYRTIDFARSSTMDQMGFTIQGGFFFNEDWEGFARYEWADPDSSDIEDLNVVTLGVNRYWHKHNLKWTTDVGFGLDEVSSPFASNGVGWQADASGEDGQIVLRSQFQLLF